MNTSVNTQPPADLVALSEKATPGPWHWSKNGNIVPDGYFKDHWTKPDMEIAAVYTERDDEDAPANAEFIIALVNWFRSQDWARPSLSAQAVGDIPSVVAYPSNTTPERSLRLDEWLERWLATCDAHEGIVFRALIEFLRTPPQPADGGDRVGELVRALAGLLAVYAEPDRAMCCDGRDCGCMGASTYQEAEHYARAALAKFQPAGGES